jgi:hypothetical protein
MAPPAHRIPVWIMIFAVAALPSFCSAQNVITSRFFGLHANSGQWPSVSWGAYRSWDAGVRWMLLNPSYGSYYWSTLDYELDSSYADGARDFMYTFGVVPSWASTNPNGTGCSWANGSCYMPVVSDFTTFVQAIAQHSAARKAAGKPGITIYELWNEPNATNFWQGTTDQMVELAKAAYPLIHQYDPTAKVATPAPQGTYGWNWMQGYFAAGGAPYADSIDFHGYVGAQMPEAGLANLANIRQLSVQYGASSKPLQDTEAYWWTIADTTAQTAWLARHYLLEASQGLSAVYWYAWNYGGKLQGTTNATAYTQLYSWLVGRTIAPCVQTGTVWTCNLSGDSGWAGLAVWNTAGSSTFTVPAQFTGWQDMFGAVHALSSSSVTIGTIPILLTGSLSNGSPTAVISVSPDSGTAPVAISASTSLSTDPNGTIVFSAIDFGDGTVTDAQTASHTYKKSGHYTVTATIRDNYGATSTASTLVSVAPLHGNAKN